MIFPVLINVFENDILCVCVTVVVRPPWTKVYTFWLKRLKTNFKLFPSLNIWTLKNSWHSFVLLIFLQVLKSSPSSSEDALTSMRSSQTNLRRQYSKQPGLPTMDRFLSHLGNPGRYQIIIMVLLAANCIPVVVNHLLMTFYAVKTPHNCRVSIYTLKYVFAGSFCGGLRNHF